MRKNKQNEFPQSRTVDVKVDWKTYSEKMIIFYTNEGSGMGLLLISTTITTTT